MKRKEFLKKGLIAGAAAAAAPGILKARNVKLKESTYDRMMDQVGFNHLPNMETTTMNTVVHKASTRGHANHGWLDSHHSFSFANYYNPERMHFGVLRVLNDDSVAPAKGFGTHPHDNMEIISIPLSGDLEHKDSMGNVSVIKEGDVQVMSAGTGIYHSEYNKNADKDVKFLQIWVFPREKNVKPRYDQISIRDIEKKNEFYQVLSPNPDDQGVWVHQDAWFHLGNFDAGTSQTVELNKSGNGFYFFVLEGSVELGGEKLTKRDGMGIWDTDKVDFKASSNARVLLMEVPMRLG
jgi:redox-sensitive bicupin YhaK (pirin superfamily)